MTTIAYRDGVLAADTLRTSNGLRDGYVIKAWKVGPLLFSAAGATATCEKFRSWVMDGLQGASPFSEKDTDGNGLVALPDQTLVVWCEAGPWRVHDAFYALGTGYQVAMGAMQHGATAAQAVAAAIAIDTHSGGEITVLTH